MSGPVLVTEDCEADLSAAAGAFDDSARSEQTSSAAAGDWSQKSLASRLRILRGTRHLLAARSAELTATISPELSRNRADTLAAEVLPLLAAIKFLEDQAGRILRPRRLGRNGLPVWLAGLDVTMDRVALGTVLIIGPANYPLLLPGVQALQALAAGNCVIWKPGRGGYAVAAAVASALYAAGLPREALRLTDESAEAGVRAIAERPAKIVFTGSAYAGCAVQRLAAEASIPVIAELSGCDAVFVLEGADLDRVADALCFGMRLNGSSTCMAPRRLFVVNGQGALIPRLEERFRSMDAVPLNPALGALLEDLLEDARTHGAELFGEVSRRSVQPLLVLNGSPQMRLAQTDLFAPVLSVFLASSAEEAATMYAQCPLNLTVSVFGEERLARSFAARFDSTNVMINDLIVPTADPRIPFGGRGASGFGVTRGAEGLLEMTAARTTSVRRSRSRRHFQPTTPAHEAFFTGIIQASHAGTWRERIDGIRTLIGAAKQLK